MRRHGLKYFNAKRKAGLLPADPPAAQQGPASASGPESPLDAKTPATAATASQPGDTAPGSRGDRTEAGLKPLEEAKMRLRAIRAGWIKPDEERWPLDATAADLVELQKAHPAKQLGAADSAMLAVLADLTCEDPKVRETAVRSIVAMRSQQIAMRGQELADGHHKDRMEYHRQAMAAKTGYRPGGGGTTINIGGAGGDEENQGPGRIAIFIPWDGRDPLPHGAINQMDIDGLAVETDLDQTVKTDEQLEQP
jgi:hypothetical protein